VNGDRRPAAACPVCRARFRCAVACSRCGADLTALMLLTAHAYRLRQQARHLLREGDCSKALHCAEKAQRLQATPEGHLLHWLCAATCGQNPKLSAFDSLARDAFASGSYDRNVFPEGRTDE